jgi:hypothetical protein
MIQGLGLFLAESVPITLPEGGIIGLATVAVGVLWRRAIILEDRSHNDSLASLKAVEAMANALKDSVKTVERQTSEIKVLTEEVRALRAQIHDLPSKVAHK